MKICQDARSAGAYAHWLWPWQPYTLADEIVPGIWLGNVCGGLSAQFLFDHNISFSLSVAREWPYEGTYMHTQFHHLPGLGDSENESSEATLAIFTAGVALMQERRAQDPGGSLIVYCNMGISRSASVVMAYLISQGLDPALVKANRPVATPNPLYQRVLDSFAGVQGGTEL